METPKTMTLTLDLTDATTLHECLAAIPEGVRDRISETIRRIDEARNVRSIVAKVREQISKELDTVPGRTVVGVALGSSQFDEGYFLDGEGCVLWDDGHVEKHDFVHVRDELDEEFGAVGPTGVLVLDLRTDSLDMGQWGPVDEEDTEKIYRRFRFQPAPVENSDDEIVVLPLTLVRTPRNEIR